MSHPSSRSDVHGVVVRLSRGVRRARSTKPDIKLGVCGEHGGDPASIHFPDQVDSTTCPARRSACLSHVWKPVAAVEDCCTVMPEMN